MTERVFVSGEDGLLARGIIIGLRARGHVILNDEIEKTWYLPRTIMEAVGVGGTAREPEVNVLSERALTRIVDLDPTLVIHAAAMVGTDKCILDERLAWKCNVETTFNMAWVARRAGARLVYFSSSAVYDPDASVPRPYSVDADETYPPRPRTIYGQTKYLGEHVCANVFGPDNLLIVRPSFVYGGARDTSSTITRLAKSVIFDGPPVDVLLDKKNRKDFMYVDDFVGIMLGLITGGANGTYDVVRGHPRPFGDALLILATFLGWGEVKAKMRYRPEGDYMGDHYAWGQIRYTPSVDLEDGLARVVRELEDLRDGPIVIAG